MSEAGQVARNGCADGGWTRCGGCGALVYGKKLARGLKVCAECGHHHRLTAPERIRALVDEDSFVPLDVSVTATDVLGFTDSRPYRDRLAQAREHTGLDDAVVCGTGRLGGVPLCLCVLDFRFLGGSLGVAVGELITRTAEHALRQRLPVLLVTASGGARMQEGVLALMQMAKVSQALAELRAEGLLSVSLVTDPTYGGVAASFATNTDVVLVEQGARMGFAGPRVIEQTIRQELPRDFQTADFLLSHGQVDAVRHRRDVREWLRTLLVATGYGADVRTEDHARGGPEEPARGTGDVEQEHPATVPETAAHAGRLVRDPDALVETDPWEVVRAARDTARPTLLDYVEESFEGFVELHGDRVHADSPAVVAGFATLAGRPVAVVGHQKGHDTRELAARNFGMPGPEGYRKALRVMRLAARFGIPVVSLVDTPGAYPGREAEEGGQSVAIAGTILAMFELPVPVVTVVVGEGGSGGALALAVADRVLIAERGTYSVISPEGCSAILWGDAESAPRAARALRVTARELLELGVVDAVLPEPAGGASADPVEMTTRLRAALVSELDALSGVDSERLVRLRRRRFRSFGAGGYQVLHAHDGGRQGPKVAV